MTSNTGQVGPIGLSLKRLQFILKPNSFKALAKNRQASSRKWTQVELA